MLKNQISDSDFPLGGSRATGRFLDKVSFSRTVGLILPGGGSQIDGLNGLKRFAPYIPIIKVVQSKCKRMRGEVLLFMRWLIMIFKVLYLFSEETGRPLVSIGLHTNPEKGNFRPTQNLGLARSDLGKAWLAE